MRHTEFYKVGFTEGRLQERKFILDLLQKSITAQMEEGTDNISVTINYALTRCHENLQEDLQEYTIQD